MENFSTDEVASQPLCRYKSRLGTRVVLALPNKEGRFRVVLFDYPVQSRDLDKYESHYLVPLSGDPQKVREAIERFREMGEQTGITRTAQKTLDKIEEGAVGHSVGAGADSASA